MRHAVLWIVRNQISGLWRPAAQFLLGSVGLALLTLVCFRLQLNLASAAFGYLIVIVLLSLRAVLLYQAFSQSSPLDA